jgi:hypothetical protein
MNYSSIFLGGGETQDQHSNPIRIVPQISIRSVSPNPQPHATPTQPTRWELLSRSCFQELEGYLNPMQEARKRCGWARRTWRGGLGGRPRRRRGPEGQASWWPRRLKRAAARVPALGTIHRPTPPPPPLGRCAPTLERR